METRHLFLALLVAAATAAATARTASQFFAEAPDDVLPLLSKTARLDMLDYLKYGSDNPTANSLGGKARATAVTDAEVRFSTSEGSEGQLVVIPLSATDTVVAVVQTLRVPQPESAVKFFTTAWAPAKVQFAVPSASDWYTPAAKADPVGTAEFVPFVLWQAAVEPDGSRITLSNTMGSYYAPADSARAQELLVPQIVYTRSGSKFVKEK